jgi:exosortase
MPEQPMNRPDHGIIEEFRLEFLECWKQLPNKGFFLLLLGAWLALFQFFGNSALGYVRTPSLMGWMWTVYSSPGADGVAEDAHGKLVPLVVLALFWWKRKSLLALELKLWWPALLLVGLGLVIHILGYAIEQSRISIVGMFTGIYGLMGLAWGLGFLRRSFFPFFLFAFCIPLGAVIQPITFPLRLLVTVLVQFICNFMSIDVVRVGTSLTDPTGRYQYEVAAACSGIHSLVATVGFALVYAALSFQKWWKRGLLILSAVPLAVLGNVVRMMTIVIAAEFGGQGAGNYVHTGGPLGILSLLPYIPAFAGLLLLGHWLREPGPRPEPAAAAARPLEPTLP